MSKKKIAPKVYLKWVQSDFMESIPIYYVEVPEYQQANAICVRIEYLFHEKYWIVDICQTVRVIGEFTLEQLEEVKIYAEQQLTSYIQAIQKLFIK